MYLFECYTITHFVSLQANDLQPQDPNGKVSIIVCNGLLVSALLCVV